MPGRTLLVALIFSTLFPFQAAAQSPADLTVLRGLAPVSALSTTSAGRAALGANYTVTGGIHTGEWRQPTLLPFAEQQQLALRDVFSTYGNLVQLADGLGTTLGSAYTARAHYIDRDEFTSLSESMADLIAYSLAAARTHSTAAKYYFANFTTDGTDPVSEEAKAILEDVGGSPDMFGHAYGMPAGTEGAGKYGDARPFQTEPEFVRIMGRDYFGSPADNIVYNRGPMMNLTNNPSYPSGHTTYGYVGSVLLGLMVPERYPEMMTRAAEAGNHRVIVGAHYVMDVLAGRTLALYTMAQLLAHNPDYMGRSFRPSSVGRAFAEIPVITDFRAAVAEARADVRAFLEQTCGKPTAECAKEDTGRFSDAAANEAFHASTLTYGLPVAHPEAADNVTNVDELAPEAGYLLTVAFPSLTVTEANEILTRTLAPAGGFLDDGSAFGVYSRLDLYTAAQHAERLVTERSTTAARR